MICLDTIFFVCTNEHALHYFLKQKEAQLKFQKRVTKLLGYNFEIQKMWQMLTHVCHLPLIWHLLLSLH